jgi:hypothetical protein
MSQIDAGKSLIQSLLSQKAPMRVAAAQYPGKQER